MFAEPGWLLALAAVPAALAAALVALRRDRERVARLVARPLWPRVVRTPAEHWRWVRLGLLLLGIAGVVLALARPQWGIVRERVEREGVDVVLVLDTSGSMATPDVQPSRFFLARAALLSLVSQLYQDRFALVAFEGEAYPLVPLTLDADAVGLFLETLETGFVPGPGSALGLGLERGLELFVDEGRRNKVMVLVSDGENLEGEVEAAVKRAREAGVVIHTVGVGTEQGQPVPDFDDQGRPAGFKKDESGQVVVSRLDAATLQRIAEGTGGRYFRIRPSDSSLRPLAAAIDEMEDRALAREFAYRKKDRFQVPLGVGLAALTLGLLLPLPRRRLGAAGLVLLAGLGPRAAHAQTPPQPGTASQAQAAPQGTPAVPGAAGEAAELPAPLSGADAVLGELLLRPPRLTDRGLEKLQTGDHPGALEDFANAALARPSAPQTHFNLAGALYRNDRFDDAAAIYESLSNAEDPALAGAARYNRGNALFEKQDYPGAIGAYRSALDLLPEDENVRRNLELALRKLQEQQEREQQQQEQQQQQDQQQEGEQDPQSGDQQQGQDTQQGDSEQREQPEGQDEQQEESQQPQPGDEQQQRQPQPQPSDSSDRPPSADEREQQRFREEAGMPRERAMQLLDALQQNEKEEQKKVLAARKKKKKGKDW